MTKMADEYLGDGVYASFDGEHVTVDLRGSAVYVSDKYDKIALEESVFRKLMAYGTAAFTRECKFAVGDPVTYVPTHADGDVTHKDCEHGIVHRIGEGNTVFVNFTCPRIQGCDEGDLVKR